jgi:precorrin-6A/cobalt-precorrin-6A reductase
VPLVRLLRPPWTPQAGDRWVGVAGLPEAAAAIDELGARVAFLTVGRRELHHFDRARHTRFVVRSIHRPERLPPRTTLVLDRGPYELAAERDLLVRHGVEVIVAKNAGGTATRAKLDAARELGIPVVMVERPSQPAVPRVATPEDARRWVQVTLGRR